MSARTSQVPSQGVQGVRDVVRAALLNSEEHLSPPSWVSALNPESRAQAKVTKPSNTSHRNSVKAFPSP